MTIILPFKIPDAEIRASADGPPDHPPPSGPGRRGTAPGTSAASWVESFACHRRRPQEVYWLKENAELLSLLRVMQQRAGGPAGAGGIGGEAALSPLRPFCDGAARQLRFFPQYYRFILSICLDYEDLTGTPAAAAELAHWAAAQGLVEAELSDLQRAEAQQLLARRGIALPVDPGLADRLRRFTRRSATFAIPNRKAAYELTHIVFYLSDYGRRDPGLDARALQSLTYAGLLACLDQDLDLLAEICIALRYAGATPPPYWEQLLSHATAQFTLTPDGFDGRMDGYHTCFVTLWWQQVTAVGRKAEPACRLPAGAGQALHIAAPATRSLLAPLSVWLMEAGAGPGRTAPALWQDALSHMAAHSGPDARKQLRNLQNSTPAFEAFWQIFSRAGDCHARYRRIGAGGLSLSP
ncbi:MULTISPECIES: DUF6902 family protein [unclassified Phaeobacter]|uniref:DUF6902 family protein n=7 Tax=Phaeobacter TaxID=302485 RepID=UPI003A84A1CE